MTKDLIDEILNNIGLERIENEDCNEGPARNTKKTGSQLHLNICF